MKNPGQLLEDESGNKYIAYNKEQSPAFVQVKKLLVHHMSADFKYQTDEKGKRIIGLKAIDKLKLIGYTD